MKLMEKQTNFDRTTNMLDIHVKVWIPEILEFTTPAFGNALANQGASQTPVVFNFVLNLMNALEPSPNPAPAPAPVAEVRKEESQPRMEIPVQMPVQTPIQNRKPLAIDERIRMNKPVPMMELRRERVREVEPIQEDLAAKYAKLLL